MNKCSVCSVDTNIDSDIVCDGCNKMVHLSCSKLSRDEVILLRGRTRTLKYMCPNCESRDVEIKALKSMVEMLQKDITELKTNVNKGTEQKQVNMDMLVETAIAEMVEREWRAKNVIVYRVKESKSQDINIRINEDVQIVKEALAPVVDISSMDVKVVRIGKMDATKVRPVKVIFKTKNDAMNVLRNKKKITKFNLAADRTKAQQKILQQVQAEFEERESNGEENITIKYVGGVPTIVEVKPVNKKQYRDRE